jgi:uncharacterized membrane protein
MMLKLVIGLLAVIYPLAMYFGLTYFDAKTIGPFVLAVVALRFWSNKNLRPYIVAAFIITATVLWLSNSALLLKFIPVAMNVFMLSIFAWSLHRPPSMIETFARRLRKDDMPPHVIIYTRKVTQIWCGFFIINGIIAAYTALFCSLQIWTLYNGLIAYIVMGCLLAGEFAYRQIVIKRQGE